MMSAEDNRVGQVGRRRPLLAAAPETSGFSQTCNLLSQFLKGKGGSLKDISPQIATQLEEKPKPKPKDYNLGNPPKLLLIEEEEKKMTPMTIFYAGKVTVFYHLSPEKANHLLTTLAHQQYFTPPQSPPADLPIARRVSLHRFLDKRKARVMAKAPYTTSSPKEL